MVRVVELPASKRCICHQCKATLEYEYSDVRCSWESDYGGGKDRVCRINCPHCGAQPSVKEWSNR